MGERGVIEGRKESGGRGRGRESGRCKMNAAAQPNPL